MIQDFKLFSVAHVQYNERDHFCAIYVTGCAEIQNTTESCWDWEEQGGGNGTSDSEIIWEYGVLYNHILSEA